MVVKDKELKETEYEVERVIADINQKRAVLDESNI
jgi:hypothetical protein